MSEELMALLREAVEHQCKLDQLLGEIEEQTTGPGNWSLLQNKLVTDYVRQLAASTSDNCSKLQTVTSSHVEELRKLLKPPRL